MSQYHTQSVLRKGEIELAGEEQPLTTKVGGHLGEYGESLASPDRVESAARTERTEETPVAVPASPARPQSEARAKKRKRPELRLEGFKVKRNDLWTSDWDVRVGDSKCLEFNLRPLGRPRQSYLSRTIHSLLRKLESFWK